jgi:transcription initiation factor TFIIE subunit alpha
MAKKKSPKKKAPAPRAPKPKKSGRDDALTEVIKEVAGEDVLPLVRALKNKKNISEFKLADSIKKEINLTRNMLYRLYDQHLVTFIRKKDKKKGWYIYYWTFNPKRIKELVRNLKKTRVEKLRERLHREQSTNFFVCANKCMRLDFDQATEFEYKCPECGEMLHQEDNSKTIAELQKEIQKLEKELSVK